MLCTGVDPAYVPAAVNNPSADPRKTFAVPPEAALPEAVPLNTD
jgi:hypothetical protein